MQHTESSIKIYHTKEYARFNMISGNRRLNEPKINRIIKDINEGLDVLRYCPILVKEVNNRLDIIDGQHRFYVSRKLKCGVWYILSEEMDLHDIARINSNTDKWKDSDFINCYVQQGNDNYIVLQNFIEKHQFPIGVSINMLAKGYLVGEGGGTAGFKHKFRNGQFEVEELETAESLSLIVKQFDFFSGHKTGSFIEAISRIVRGEKITIADLKKKVEKDTSRLTICRNAKEYLNLLEGIYNQNNRIRQIIY